MDNQGHYFPFVFEAKLSVMNSVNRRSRVFLTLVAFYNLSSLKICFLYIILKWQVLCNLECYMLLKKHYYSKDVDNTKKNTKILHMWGCLLNLIYTLQAK